MMFIFDVYCVLLWFQPGTEDIKLVMFCFWLINTFRKNWITSDKIDVFLCFQC